MDEKLEFSVDHKVLNNLDLNGSGNNRGTRYHWSHAVWQLARMGAYNTAGSLPLKIRLERYDEVAELYPDQERYVALLDAVDADADPVESKLFYDILVRLAVRRVKSRKPELLHGHIISSAKPFQSDISQLSAHENAGKIKENLVGRISELIVTGDLMPKNTDIDELARKVIEKTTVEYRRRRHGRHGDDTLWGNELDAIKVLQDAGIAGKDLHPALQALITAVELPETSKSAPRTFTRKAAYLLIRDFQRRAYISMPSVRVIDERFITETQPVNGALPFVPCWKAIAQPEQTSTEGFIRRETFDSAVKWARRAAAVAGRGLLPVFLFTGESGSGKSAILKQTALALYHQGFAVAEILDIEAAAEEADRLANAAVAGDSPLVLLWDDPLGLGTDPVASVKEIAAAQISGAPVVILSSAPNKDIYPKFFSRTAIEEFMLHPLQPQELELLGAEPGSEPENAAKAWMRLKGKGSIEDLAKRCWDAVKGCDEAIQTAFKLTVLFGTMGLSVPVKIICSEESGLSVETVMAVKTSQDEPVFRLSANHDSSCGELINTGHLLLADAQWQQIQMPREQIPGTLHTAMKICVETKSLQPWILRIFKAATAGNMQNLDIKELIFGIYKEVLTQHPDLINTLILARLFSLVKDLGHEELLQIVVDIIAERVRAGDVDSFTALAPLLRNRLGGLTDEDALKALNAAQPSIDRIGFKFLLKFLGDHLPGDMGQRAVDDARTSAARDPDEGYAVAAYLKLAWQRGSEDQQKRVIMETNGWLEANPEDRVVRRAFVDLVVKKGDETLRRQIQEPLETWLANHYDEGPLRKSYLELALNLNDPQLLDRVLDQIGDWIEKRGNNRAVRNLYFRQSEQRKDKTIMAKACRAGLAWIVNHPEDRDTLRSLMFLTGRIKDEEMTAGTLHAVNRWMTAHHLERDMVRHYLTLAERAGKGRVMNDVMQVVDQYLDENPDDMEIREVTLGLASKKCSKRLQVKVYNKQSLWLESKPDSPPMVEYLLGRLGVRAGIARRAIPLLERAVARDSSELKLHASLWLGSAYRVAGEYLFARKVWEEVKNSDDAQMKEKAEKNLESLESFLLEKFPDGYPPKPEPRPVRRPPRPAATAAEGEGQEQSERPPRPRRDARTDGRFERGRKPRSDEPRTSEPGAADGRRAAPSEHRAPRPPREGKPRQDKPRDRDDFRKSDRKGQKQQAPVKETRHAATLGDLLRLQGLDLTEALKPKQDK